MYIYLKFLLFILVLSAVTNKLFWINGTDFYVVFSFYPIEKSGILVELGNRFWNYFRDLGHAWFFHNSGLNKKGWQLDRAMKMGKTIVALRSTSSKYDCDFSEMKYKMLALKKRSFEGGFSL